MKKTARILALICLSVLLCALLASCEQMHTHVGEWTVTKENTCLEAGEQTRTCEQCGQTEKQELPAKGHTPGKEATCTQKQKCTECNAVLEGAKGHTPGAAATCTEAQICTVCNEIITEALGHTPGDGATCEETGKCSVCGEVLESVDGHIPGAEASCESAQICLVCNKELNAALGHTEGAAATCESAQTCTVCNKELNAALGHTEGAAATCESAQTCTVCNKVLVQAFGHSPNAASCTQSQLCTVCNKILAEATGHTESAAATCARAQTCIKCNEVLAEALPHTPGAAATCKNPQLCTVCGHIVTAALPHTEVIDPEVPATSGTSGLTQGKHCSVCNEILIAQRVITPAGAPDEYRIMVDDKGIYCMNLLDFNAGTNELWACYNEDTGKWECKYKWGELEQPTDDDLNPIAPILRSYSSFSAHRWSLIEGGEVFRFESTDSSIYPGISFCIDEMQEGIMPIGRETGNPAKAEYVKVRIRNHSVCDQMTFAFVLRNTNNGNFVNATISELTVDACGKEYDSSGEWVTYTFSMYELNMNTNYKELIYDPNDENATPTSRWGSQLFELLIFPFGYDVTDGSGNYPGAAMDIDYIVVGSRDYVESYQSALEIKEEQVQMLELVQAPEKKIYYVGEALDLTGLELKATYTDGTEETFHSASASVGTFDEVVNEVTLKFGKQTVSFPVKVIDITGIEMVEAPHNMSFKTDDLENGFISDGYRFKVTYADGTYKLSDIDPSNTNDAELANACFRFTGDFQSSGLQTVTVSYFGKSTTFDINIIHVVDMEVVCNKTYRYNSIPREDDFSVYLIYSDGSKVYENYIFSYSIDCNCKTPGTTKATITITDEYHQLTLSKDVDVYVEAPVGVEIGKMPYKTEYNVGEAFDVYGLQINLIYADGIKVKVGLDDYYVNVNTASSGDQMAQIKSDVVGLKEIFEAADLQIAIRVR